MSNNTPVDPIETKPVHVKTGNMCKVRGHLNNLYDKYGVVADAINLIIGEGDDTPDLINNLSETIEKVRNIDGVEVSHLGGTHVTDSPFTFSDSYVRLNWNCYNLGESNEPNSHYAPLPVASRVNAGILNSDDYKKLDNVGEYTNIYHTGGSSGHTLTWSGDDSNVYLQFSNTNPSNNNTTEYNATTNKQAFPVASATKAGIITAEMYRNLNNWFTKDSCSGDSKVNTYEEIVDFLDGTENTSSVRDICIFEGHVSLQDFTISQDTNYTAISLNDLIFLCPSDTYVIDGEICRNAHFYGRDGTELIPEKTESVVFLIDQSAVITYLNEIESEPVSEVIFKSSPSSSISWRLEILRLRIGFITGTAGQIGLLDANTLFNQNNTISISRRGSFPTPLLSRLTTINNRLNNVETKCNNFTTNKVDVEKTVTLGQDSILSKYDRDENNGLLLYRQNNNTSTTSKVFLNEYVKLLSIDQSNFLLNTSSIILNPTDINVAIDSGPNIELVKENSNNVKINSDSFIVSSIGNSSNITLDVNQTSGLKVTFSDDSYINYKTNGTQDIVYNLTLTLNYLRRNIVKGAYSDLTTYQGDPSEELSIIFPFSILNGVDINNIIPTTIESLTRGRFPIIGITDDLQRFKIYIVEEEEEGETEYNYYFLIELNNPVKVTNIAYLSYGINLDRTGIKFISVTN